MEIIGGGTPKTTVKEYWGGDIPWLSVVDFGGGNRHVYKTEKSITQKGLEESSTKILKKGQVIISARGTVGEIAQLGCDMAFNQSCYGLVGEQEIVQNDFLYYLLKNSVTDLQKNTHGAVFDTITRQTFDCIDVDVPPLPTQKKIAKILGDLDEKIELNHQMNKTLESIAQAVFKKWFVEESDFSETVQLKDIIDFDPSLSLKKGQETIYVDMAGLSTENMTVDNFILKEFAGGSKFQNGDTLLARITPCLENGKTAFVNFLCDQKTVGFGSTEFIVMRAKKGISPQFVYCLARDDEFRSFAIKSMVGSSGRQRVQRVMLESYEIAKPSQNLMERFDQLTAFMFNRVGELLVETIRLKEIRDSLLPKLMSGKVRVDG